MAVPKWQALAQQAAKNPNMWLQRARQQAQTTHSTPPPPVRQGPTTTTTQVPAPPPTPFLTPAQQAALNLWNTTYQGDLANLKQADLDAQASHDQSLANDTLTNAKNVDTTNQSDAARGVFLSSIHDGALNDLAATLAQQTNILNTNLHATLLKDQTQRETLGGRDAATQAEYGGFAVENAQALPPNTATTTQTTTTPGAAQQAPVAPHPVGNPHLAPPPHPQAPPAPQQPGGWSVLSHPGVAQAFTNAVNRTAQNPHGTAPRPGGAGLARAAALRAGGGA